MILSLIAGLAMAAGEPDRAVDIAALTKAKEVDWNGYYRRQDADGLARFLEDDFVHFQADGTIETKDQAVDWVRNNSWDVGGTFKYVVSDIAFYGPDTANVYEAALAASERVMRHTESLGALARDLAA